MVCFGLLGAWCKWCSSAFSFSQQFFILYFILDKSILPSGIPDDFGQRPKCWKLLLNYLPLCRDEWPKFLDEQRQHYIRYIREFLLVSFYPSVLSSLHFNVFVYFLFRGHDRQPRLPSGRPPTQPEPGEQLDEFLQRQRSPAPDRQGRPSAVPRNVLLPGSHRVSLQTDGLRREQRREAASPRAERNPPIRVSHQARDRREQGSIFQYLASDGSVDCP